MSGQELSAAAALVLTACFGCVLLKKINPAAALALSLTAGALAAIPFLRAMGPLTAFLQRLETAGPWPEEGLTVLTKALGIGILCSMGCSVCADCGEHFLEQQVLLAGKAGLILTGLPLLNAFFEKAEALLETMGGG